MLIAALFAVQAIATTTTACPADAGAQAASQCPRYIFFDSGKAEIRREWEPVLDEAASLAKGGARLLVTGSSDREGSASGNRLMGQRRASAVADALKARGVTAAQIVTGSQGEEDPLVQTADGVREIQNRRVSITLAR